MAQKKIHEYDFCNIPNNEEGKLFRKLLNKYINKDKYGRIDVKGQKLKPGRRWQDFRYGYPVKESETLRVYLRKKESDAERFSQYWQEAFNSGKRQAQREIVESVLTELESST